MKIQLYVYLFCGLLIVENDTFAAECYIKSGVVSSLDGSLRYEPGKEIATCTGYTSAAVICFTNKLDQPICQTVTGEFNFNSLLGKNDSTLVTQLTSMAQLIKILFSPDTTTATYYGGKHLKESEYLAGFPYGVILLPEKSLLISTNPEVQKGFLNFELYDRAKNGQPIYKSSDVKSEIRMPVSYLSHDKIFKWVVYSKNQTYSGTFSVSNKEEQIEFELELKGAIKKSDPSISTKQLLRALLAKDYGFTFDMQQSIDAARISLQHGG